MNQLAKKTISIACLTSLLATGCNAKPSDGSEFKSTSTTQAETLIANAQSSQQNQTGCPGEHYEIAQWLENSEPLSLTGCLTAELNETGEYHLKEHLNIQLLNDKSHALLWDYKLSTKVTLAALSIEKTAASIKDIDGDSRIDFALIVSEGGDGEDPDLLTQIAYVGSTTYIREGILPRTQYGLDRYKRGEFTSSTAEKLNIYSQQALNATWDNYVRSAYIERGITVGNPTQSSASENPESNNSGTELKPENFPASISECGATNLDTTSLIDTYEESVQLMKSMIGQPANFAGHYYLIQLPTSPAYQHTYAIVDCITGKQVANLDRYYTDYEPDNHDNGYEEIASATSRLLILKGILGDGEIAKPESYQSEYYEMINGELRLLRKTQPVIIRH